MSLSDTSRAVESAVFLIKLVHSSETQYCSCRDGMDHLPDDYVVVETRYGNDLGKVLGRIQALPEQGKDDDSDHDEHGADRLDSQADLYGITRKATELDLKRFLDNQPREAEAFHICREKIFTRGLEMKLVSAHYLLEESKILFYFTADARVDFRELVKDLVSVFKMRIELRQIGVRDESRVVGGAGVCGRVFCCHGLTDKLKPVSIKMAKVQNLSLNSMKISGHCGRLLCCLAYEYDTYSSEKKRLPPEGCRIQYDNSIFKIAEINILSKLVKLSSDDGRILEIPFSRLAQNPETHRWEIQALDAQ